MVAGWNEQVTRGLGVSCGPVIPLNPVSVGTSSTELFNLDSPGTRYRIFLKNLGATATNSCAIQVRNSTTAAWKSIVSTSTQFTTIPSDIAGFLVASDDAITPTALTAGQEWFGAIDTRAYRYVRLVATVASGTTNIAVEVH